MFFLGYNFLGADETTIPISPIAKKDDTMVELSGVEADVLAVTKDVDFEPTKNVNTKWDTKTILLATFDNDTLAGNVKWTLSTVSHIAIKRRVVGDYKWITIAYQDVNSLDDFNIKGTDITTESLEYEYAIVPMLNGVEGKYSTAIVDVTNLDLVIIDKTGVYHTPITEGFCNTTDVHPNQVIEPLRQKYPTVVRNTIANYETIQVEGTFMPIDDNNCSYVENWDEDRTRVLYQREVKDFLTNGLTKILKNVDGQTWLVYVTTPPTDSADQTYNVRKLSFGCTETGSMKSESDLYYAGLLDVPEEYWSTG